MSHDAFASDLSAFRLCGDITELADMSADDLVDLHRRGMTDLFDKHCPVVQVRLRTKSTPIVLQHAGVQERLNAQEDAFRRRQKQLLTRLKTMHSVYEKRNDEFWRNEITANKGDTKKLWRTMQGLLGETSTDETGVYTLSTTSPPSSRTKSMLFARPPLRHRRI